MKQIKADELSSYDTMLFIGARIDKLMSLCRAMQDTAESTGSAETEADTIQRLLELSMVMADELEILDDEWILADEVALKERMLQTA